MNNYQLTIISLTKQILNNKLLKGLWLGLKGHPHTPLIVDLDKFNTWERYPKLDSTFNFDNKSHMLDKTISIFHYNAKMRILSDYLSFFTHKLSTVYMDMVIYFFIGLIFSPLPFTSSWIKTKHTNMHYGARKQVLSQIFKSIVKKMFTYLSQIFFKKILIIKYKVSFWRQTPFLPHL